MTKRISTAAYLAGVTTLAVSLPMMASAKTNAPEDVAKAKIPAGTVQVETYKAE